MANSISYASQYLRLLDAIYKKGSATAILESAESRYRLSSQSAKTIYLQELSVDGLGDYTRSSGYTSGDATLTWRAYQFGQDRGRKYNLDTMDSDEAKIQAMQIMGEIMRTHIIPEVDAYRFEKLCTDCGIDDSTDLTDDTCVTAIDTGIATLDDAEAPTEGRVLFVSNTMHKLLKQSGEIYNVRVTTGNNGVINRQIEYFDDMPLIKVPSGRFKTNFDFADGTSVGETGGGFSANVAAKDINFMIVPVNEIIAVIKHMSPKFITPEVNQSADGYIFAYRLYHDLFVAQNKRDGIYIQTKS